MNLDQLLEVIVVVHWIDSRRIERGQRDASSCWLRGVSCEVECEVTSCNTRVLGDVESRVEAFPDQEALECGIERLVLPRALRMNLEALEKVMRCRVDDRARVGNVERLLTLEHTKHELRVVVPVHLIVLEVRPDALPVLLREDRRLLELSPAESRVRSEIHQRCLFLTVL